VGRNKGIILEIASLVTALVSLGFAVAAGVLAL
jgi:hypothetical protein